MSTIEELKVLLVDDDGRAVQDYRMILEGMGFSQFKEAEDGEMAVNLAMSYIPDLVLMDTAMPKLMGYEACKIMRDIGSEAVIIGLSNDMRPGIERLWENAGANEAMEKGYACLGRSLYFEERIRELLRDRL
jgi:CheY-like chemotaxis protein